MFDDLIRRLSKPVPRYTSYPTAPHFHDGISPEIYARWLAELPHQTTLSLYLHIPFCDRLCWFCGCHTKQIQRYEPIASYVAALHKEIETVALHLGGRGLVAQIHLGGGSPSMLKPQDTILLAHKLRQLFLVKEDAEFSIEIDPNDMTPDRYEALAVAGVTRVSIGVQDFDPKVQQAINRIQTIDQTREVVETMRCKGVRSVNLDILYGLPFQTEESLDATIDEVVSMRPDRIALFGYAHVPWMKTHQRMIDETALPDVVERYHQSRFASNKLIAAGYEPIGLDHFALPRDSLAVAARSGHLRRNFQGYTTDSAPALIGLGASSVGSLPQGYVQNSIPTGDYIRRVRDGKLATVRGFEFTAEDRMRGYVIEQLMCNAQVDVRQLESLFGEQSSHVVEDMRLLCALDGEGLVTFDGRRLAMTERGRPFVRAIASVFDTYLDAGQKRHSVAV